MTPSEFDSIEKIESDLWEAADQLRANSKLASSEYMMPVLGIIFLRHASNRFNTATRQIQSDVASGKIPKRPLIAADYVSRGAIMLPEIARWNFIMKPPQPHLDLGEVLNGAMDAIENEFPPLKGVLPKEYGIFEKDVLEDLLRIFNKEILDTASGDVFGRINEYFLMKFANDQAHDKGQFFTPPSLVQTIVNVIEPEKGTVFDPACGSCGMFVQTSYFIQKHGQQTAKNVAFYGHEKTATTIRIAKMNLAVHALEGQIKEANSFYNDDKVFHLEGQCNFVMANPPFNVDKVDAEKIKNDVRLPFGLPGVNKDKKVSNANFLWISYFWSYLNEKGRAGFVMSSQASSAGHTEKEVRRKIIETGDVDVMIAIRNNFFYTRAVHCELWFFDRGKPADKKDKVLMIDARNIYRKVTRKIYDFSPEQSANITAIVWLYRGQSDRFLGLIKDYFSRVCEESANADEKISSFEKSLDEIRTSINPVSAQVGTMNNSGNENITLFTNTLQEFDTLYPLYKKDRENLLKNLQSFNSRYCKSLPETNKDQHTARESFDPIDTQIKGLIKQIDLLAKYFNRISDTLGIIASETTGDFSFDKRTIARQIKQLEDQRNTVTDQLRLAVYFHRQILWLQERFPDAQLSDVEGLVKFVDRKDIEKHDWSLSPGRYVGAAPKEVDEDFDFEQTIRDIHIELEDLNRESLELANKIQSNLKDLVI